MIINKEVWNLKKSQIFLVESLIIGMKMLHGAVL